MNEVMKEIASHYRKQQAVTSWTKVDMLLELYDHAISNLEVCQTTPEEARADDAVFSQAYLSAQKALWGLFSGIDAEANEVAFNVLRLLHFVVVKIEEAEFDISINTLKGLRSAFASVQAEVNELELSGQLDIKSHTLGVQVTA
ncbi:MAG: hypothetical protein AAF394_11160 [Planctomycetota bacterium]